MNKVIEKYVKYFKNPKTLIILGLAGILLIFLSSFSVSDKKTPNPETETELTAMDYKTQLEADIAEMVKDITGERSVSVIVTLESGVRYSYAETAEESLSEKNLDREISSDSEIKAGYITVKTADGGEEALLVTKMMPEIRGVAIVCEGGDIESVNEKIKNAVTAALNITSKRVYICGRKTK
ncbi:MAG: stage III sporulation protein AG [Clostridia bacterium]|nr:stage III sporulation protein AG [Clostridia bacterium]